MSLVQGHHILMYSHVRPHAVILIFGLHVKCQLFFFFCLQEQQIMFLDEKVLPVMDNTI